MPICAPCSPCDRIPLALPVPALRFHVDPCVLARQEVCYVGEPVALVVADSRQQAEDAAALVELDVRPLPAVLEPRAGLEPGAPRARLDCPDNLVAHRVVEYGDVERAFAGADHRSSEHFRIHKGGGHSIEARGVLARYDATDELLTVWDSTQMPHKTKRVLVEALGLSEAARSRHRARCRRRLRPKNRVLSRRAGGPGGRACSWAARSNGSRTAANVSPPPITNATRIGRSKPRSTRDGRLLGDPRPAAPRPRRHDAVTAVALPFNSATDLHRALYPAGLSARASSLPDQQDAGDVDARRRTPAGHLRDGAPARSRRATSLASAATRSAAAT